MYAATTVFFECLTGNRPFHAHEGELAKVHMGQPVPLAEVPEPVRPLVAAGLAKHPDQRPPSAAEFVRQLESVAGQAYGDEWESRGRRRLAGLAAALAALFPLAAHLAGGAGVPGLATPSSVPPAPGGPAGTSVPPVPKPWRLKAGAALAAAGALTVATVVIVTNVADDPPPPAAASPTTPPPPTTPADPFGGRKACPLVGAAVAENAEFDEPKRSTGSAGPVVDDCYATREPGGGLVVTLFASPYTKVDPEDGELTRINGRHRADRHAGPVHGVTRRRTTLPARRGRQEGRSPAPMAVAGSVSSRRRAPRRRPDRSHFLARGITRPSDRPALAAERRNENG